MRFVLIALVLSTGCQRHKSECGPAIAGAVDRMVADARGKMPPPVAANIARVVPQMKSGLTASCEADHWAPAAIECVSKADGVEALEACDRLLTQQQRDNEHKRSDEILKTAIQPFQHAAPDKPRRDPHEGLGIPPANPPDPTGSAN
ncbi:MAG: hypothetical protein ABI678_03250 [Kofleriaceae bacterium]